MAEQEQPQPPFMLQLKRTTGTMDFRLTEIELLSTATNFEQCVRGLELLIIKLNELKEK